MNAIPTAFSLAVSLLVVASLWSWAAALKKLIAGQPLLAYEPRPQPAWQILDVFFTVLLLLAMQGLAGILMQSVSAPDLEAAAQPLAGQDADSPATQLAIVLGGLASLLACGLGGLFIVGRTGARWGRDLGLTLGQAGRDIASGLVAFAMLAPIIYTMQLILVQWFPSAHPLIESFRAHPTLSFYLACVFSAAIVAPLVEEFVCRVLFQGWLERVFASASAKQPFFFQPATGLPQIEPEPLPAALPSPPAEIESNPYAPPTRANQTGGGEAGDPLRPPVEPPGKFASAAPILISSTVFAGLHWSHGPDPIPLFVLALGLGYLYQRTHRILPCVVLHFLVNAFSLVVLALSLVAA